jgi:hypothetical protein
LPPYGGAVRLALGSASFDVADRALVVAVVAAGPADAVADAAARAVTDGADVVELPVDQVGLPVAVPVAARTDDVAAALAAVDAGAALVLDPAGFAAPGWIEAVAAAGASVVGAVPVAGADVVGPLRALVVRALALGVPPHRLAVEPVPPGRTGLHLPPDPGLACAGAPVLVSCAGDEPGDVAGPLAVAAVRGAALLRVPAPAARAARRVADVVAAVRRGST